MENYIIKHAGWTEDGFGVSAFRNVGDQIQMLPEQASYLLLSGAIAVPPAPPAPAEPPKLAKGDSKNVRD